MTAEQDEEPQNTTNGDAPNPQVEEVTFHDYLLSGPPFPEDFDDLIRRDDDRERDSSFLFSK